MTERIQQITQFIEKSRYMVVFSGAGISTPSGIPDFRGEKGGLWQRYNPIQVASHSAFVKTPNLFFDWFRPLFLTSWTAQPNSAHLGLADLEKAQIIKSVITQNIDGLHQKAGSRCVLELHGSALTFSCLACCSTRSAKEVYIQFTSGRLIPLCEKCGKILKPDVVLFEELLPTEVWRDAEEEARNADLLLVIGSSLEVFPASTIPENAANRGCQLIINNLTPTPLDHFAKILIPMDTAEFIPLLVKNLLGNNVS